MRHEDVVKKIMLAQLARTLTEWHCNSFTHLIDETELQETFSAQAAYLHLLHGSAGSFFDPTWPLNAPTSETRKSAPSTGLVVKLVNLHGLHQRVLLVTLHGSPRRVVACAAPAPRELSDLHGPGSSPTALSRPSCTVASIRVARL